MNRYETMFNALREKNEGAFVPFFMLGDPSSAVSLELIITAIEAGADALELGVPFSDPGADGPTIVASHLRALDAGATVESSLELVRKIRGQFNTIPIGMLIYGNVAFSQGIDRFYQEFHDAGADSILIPDVPVRESAEFNESAHKAGICPIYISPAQASAETLEGVAAVSTGYIYAVSRDGVTGIEKESSTSGLAEVVSNIKKFGGPPVMLGFGISQPEHVAEALHAGADGAITGSAITKIIESNCTGKHPQPAKIVDLPALKSEITEYVTSMKDATRL